jgi:hypothetical protein
MVELKHAAKLFCAVAKMNSQQPFYAVHPWHIQHVVFVKRGWSVFPLACAFPRVLRCKEPPSFRGARRSGSTLIILVQAVDLALGWCLPFLFEVTNFLEDLT